MFLDLKEKEGLYNFVIPYAHPYKLSWVSEEGEIKVNKQVFINFSIGNYEDRVLYDVVPMKATYILLGSYSQTNLSR